MLSNNDFLEVIRKSFKAYLGCGTSRSTAKLKALHGSIAADLKEKFGDEFEVLSQGFENGKEGKIKGRYYDKNVDITITHKGKEVAGYAIKFVVRNYSQNSNNYFENMLGETANIRSNGIPYFQIFIIFDTLPYYSADGELKKYEEITKHNLDKYIILSKDNVDNFYHTPDKTLIIFLSLKKPDCVLSNNEQYNSFYLKNITSADLIKYSNSFSDVFKNSVIYNDYEKFIEKTYHLVKGKM